MKTLFGNRLINTIAIAIVTVFIIVILSALQYRQIQDTSVIIRHGNQVLAQSQLVQRATLQFDLNIKNFLLSHDSAFLDTARHTAALLPQQLDSLRTLVADDTVARTLIDSVQNAIGNSGQVVEEAMHHLAFSHQVQAAIQKLEASQTRFVEARRTVNRQRATQMQWALWILTVAVAILAIFIFRKMRVDRNREKYIRAQLVSSNRRLEAEVQQRTSELQYSEDKYKTLFNRSPLPKWIYDENTMKFLEVNDTAVRDYGFSREEFLDMTIADIRPAEDIGRLIEDLEDVRSQPGAYRNGHWRHRKKNGEIIDVDVTAHPIKFEGRQARMVVVNDITERRKHERQLQHLNANLANRAADLAASNAELERFAYIASHDLQEPLRMVSSFLQLLQKRYNGQLDAKADQYIHYAVDGAERMKALIMDLLEYSRVGTGKENFHPVDTTVVMQEVGNIFREKIIAAQAQVDIGYLPTVIGDSVQLTQLFQNLLSNALKYHSENPPVIHIGAVEEQGCWKFHVKDNGIGIDPQFFDKIFIIFQRLHNKTDYSGTGIGLAICKKIVERHGGRIWVESSPQQGSTFYFTIHKKD